MHDEEERHEDHQPPQRVELEREAEEEDRERDVQGIAREVEGARDDERRRRKRGIDVGARAPHRRHAREDEDRAGNAEYHADPARDLGLHER